MSWPPNERKKHDHGAAGSYLAVHLVCGRGLVADPCVSPQRRRLAILAVVRGFDEVPGALRGLGGAGGISLPPVSSGPAAIHYCHPAGGGKIVGASKDAGGAAYRSHQSGAAAAGHLAGR